MSARGARWTAVVIAAVACFSAGPGTATAGGPIAVSATAYDTADYSLILSRAKVDPGDRTVQFRNSGEDAHDLKVKRVGGTRLYSAGEVPSGGDPVTVDVHFHRRSTYVLYCSLANHRALGMEAHLKVRRRQ
jgi:plastocyanin